MGKIETLTKKLKNYLATDENILYVADTSPLKDAVYPPQVIVTNKRLIVREDKMIGQELEDFPYKSIVNLQIDEGLMFSNIIIMTPGVERRVEGLSKKEAQEVMRYTREAQMR
jgi:galactose-1-phosphate uridylyltransferase